MISREAFPVEALVKQFKEIHLIIGNSGSRLNREIESGKQFNYAATTAIAYSDWGFSQEMPKNGSRWGAKPRGAV
jgi:hypothetical protein